MAKVQWEGEILSVQPRIRLMRSFDERSHTYLGYVLRLHGTLDGRQEEFSVGIGKAAQSRHGLQVGDKVSGVAQPVEDSRKESAGFYKASGLGVVERGDSNVSPPPWHGPPPELTVYRERGHRRLAARTYDTKCRTCIWGCRMAVEIIVDHWNPTQKRYRFETFCYGPKSCGFYSPGPTRKVLGRKGTTWEEEDWVDEDATSHREMDD
jgi:hypothetical protein